MSKGKVALGRGLGALLPNQPGEEAAGLAHTRLYDFQDRARVGRVADVDIGLIDPNPFQPRTLFDEEALEELAESIRQLGIIQPITVRARDDGRFEIISGERRLRASRMAGLQQVPAYLREADTEAMLEMALVENVQREELNPIEIALGYQRLIDECALTQEQVADRVGKNRTTVTNFLRLLRLPPAVQAALRDSSISVGHARALIPVDDESVQARLLREISREGLSVRAVEDRVRKWHRKQYHPLADTPEPEPAEAEDARHRVLVSALTDRLRTRLGTKVQIRSNPGAEGGRIEVAFYSDDDLERLIDLIDS